MSDFPPVVMISGSPQLLTRSSHSLYQYVLFTVTETVRSGGGRGAGRGAAVAGERGSWGGPSRGARGGGNGGRGGEGREGGGTEAQSWPPASRLRASTAAGVTSAVMVGVPSTRTRTRSPMRSTAPIWPGQTFGEDSPSVRSRLTETS